MPSLRFVRRLLSRQSPSGKPKRLRMTVEPPSRWADSDTPFWSVLWQWIWTGQVELSSPPVAPPVLQQAREDFCAALSDLHGDAVADLRERVRFAQSLRELWHLRAELFSLISYHLNQASAQERLARVNRHFPAQAKPVGTSPTTTTTPPSKDRHARKTQP
jgi:hypothetical protein